MPQHAAASRPVRRRSSGLQTRSEIVAAAERHFAERGYEGARLEDIATDVGIRRAAIFYHFGDKQELYAEVLEEVFGGAMAALPSEGSAVERIEASLTGWIDYVARRPTVARLILREAAGVQSGVVSPLARAGATPSAWFQAVIDEGVAAGELEPIIEPHRVMSLMGAITIFHFAAMPGLRLDVSLDPWSPAEIDKHKREILLVVRNMLGIR